MTHIVLVSHGRLADALLSTAQMIVGEVQGVETIALQPGMGTEDVLAALHRVVAETETRIGILALLDLFGGSPATACARVMAVDERVEVITGANLPMLLEVLLNKDSLDVKELARLARKKGKEGIIDIRAALDGTPPDS
jgi:PTS system mannose-specific IIA component